MTSDRRSGPGEGGATPPDIASFLQHVDALSPEAGVFVTRFDRRLRLTYVNDALCRFLGWTRDELLGEEVIGSRLMTERSLPQSRASLEEVLGSRRVVTTLVEVPRRGGEPGWIQLTGYPIVDERGEVAGVQSLGFDVTGLKRQEERQRELEAQLQRRQRLEVLGKLAGGIAHDFNNLLTAAFVSLARVPTPEHGSVRELRGCLERAKDLTSQLLAFSRGQPAREEVVRVADVVRGLQGLLERLLPEGVRLEIRPPSPDELAVRADVGQLEQILLNLVVNARDAVQACGRIQVDWEAARSDAGRPVVRIRVSDDGPGIPAALRKRIFEPFFTSKAPGVGTGLGLAVVQSIAQELRGEVRVDDAPSGGARFSVELRAAAAGPRAAAPRRAADEEPAVEAPAPGTRIFLCEDQVSVRRVLREGLEECGYEVADAARASEALLHLRGPDRPFELLIADVVLPDGSGVELVGAALADGLVRRAILMSGYAGERLRDLEQLPGGVDFLPKPFTLDALVRTIAAALRPGGAPLATPSLPLAGRDEGDEPAAALLERYAGSFAEDFRRLTRDLHRAARLQDRGLYARRSHTLKGLLDFFAPSAAREDLPRVLAAVDDLRPDAVSAAIHELERAVITLWSGRGARDG